MSRSRRIAVRNAGGSPACGSVIAPTLSHAAPNARATLFAIGSSTRTLRAVGQSIRTGRHRSLPLRAVENLRSPKYRGNLGPGRKSDEEQRSEGENRSNETRDRTARWDGRLDGTGIRRRTRVLPSRSSPLPRVFPRRGWTARSSTPRRARALAARRPLVAKASRPCGAGTPARAPPKAALLAPKPVATLPAALRAARRHECLRHTNPSLRLM